ncbi:MAG: hypothetical protein M0Z55_06740 [Peptococcaceae bacterium]|nr:hypothetical protein [Peptococcaceae bacterium]
MVTFSRLGLQRILGIIWFIDGILQLKPQMFTQAFVSQVILPVAQSQPGWIAHSVNWAASIISPHIAAYNAVFAGIQLLIGLGLILNVKVKVTLLLSFVWAIIVWWFSEGFGQVLTGQALLLTGAPGAVLLYGLAGWVVWPSERNSQKSDSISNKGRKFASYSLGLIWILGSILQLQPAYLAAKGLSGAFSVDWIGNLVGTHGMEVSVILAVVELAIGLAFLFGKNVRPFIWASLILSLFFWWAGESFGQMLSSLGTDPNSGPLIILLTLCAYPNLLTLKPAKRIKEVSV